MKSKNNLKTCRRCQLFFLLFWIWVIMIIWNSTSPGNPDIVSSEKKLFFIRADYMAHFIVYFILSVFFYFWRANENYQIKQKQIVIFLTGGLFLAIGSEFIQYLTPGRNFNLIDFAANGVGIIAGLVFPVIIFRNNHNKKKD